VPAIFTLDSAARQLELVLLGCCAQSLAAISRPCYTARPILRSLLMLFLMHLLFWSCLNKLDYPWAFSVVYHQLRCPFIPQDPRLLKYELRFQFWQVPEASAKDNRKALATGTRSRNEQTKVQVWSAAKTCSAGICNQITGRHPIADSYY